MLTKSRRWFTKSSEGVRGLGDWAVKDYNDMCRDCGGGVADMLLQRGLLVRISKPLANAFRIWASKPGCSFSENGRSTWHHREACIEAKQSHEEHVTFKCT
jgi:hypothetical protein